MDVEVKHEHLVPTELIWGNVTITLITKLLLDVKTLVLNQEEAVLHPRQLNTTVFSHLG